MINHYRPPVGLMYVGGYLTHKGFKVKIIDVPLKEQIRDKKFVENIGTVVENVHQEMIALFKMLKTRIVGISCYTPEYYEVLRLAREIKAIDKNVIVVVGGVHATFYPQDLFDGQTDIDICILGDGELSMEAILHSLKNDNKRSFDNIQGIAFRDRESGKIQINLQKTFQQDLDSISYPDYNLIDMDYYANANPYAIRGCFLRTMYLLSTRGCPSQCTFCVAKKLRQYMGSGRKRSATSLIKEIIDLKKRYAIDAFYFIDDLFTIDKENVKQFCFLLKAEKMSLVWGCSSKVSTLDEDILKIMANAGCVQIDFGVERGSDEALRSVKKGINISMIKHIFSLCHKYHIRTFANMLVNLPNETERDLDDILRLLDDISSEIVSLNIFTPYPGTEIYDKSPFSFKKDEYPHLSQSMIELLKDNPERFRYAAHKVDLGKWVSANSKKYNHLLPNLRFYFDRRFWNAILHSRAKFNYLSQSSLLIKEFINQKFG